jgi:hypothetical protein
MVLIKFSCFTTNLDKYANLDVSFKKFDNLYDAIILGYKNSFKYFEPNVPNPNQFYPGYQYNSVITKYNGTTRTEIMKIYHNKIRKAKIIQRFYRKRLNRKLSAIILIQRSFRFSISCPYTQLCRNRLLREFNSM